MSNSIKEYYYYNTEGKFEDDNSIITYEKAIKTTLNYEIFPLRLVPTTLGLGALSLAYYPIYTEFLKIRITSMKKGIKRFELKKEKLFLFAKGGNYIGLGNFYSSKLIAYFIYEFLQFTPLKSIIYASFFGILSYPLLINSNLRALKVNQGLRLNSFQSWKKLYLSKASYKGYGYYYLENILFFCPIINYICHILESTRLAYVAGEHFGYSFKTLKEARVHLMTNHTLSLGRFYYNLPTHLFNILVLLAMTKNYKDNNIEL